MHGEALWPILVTVERAGSLLAQGRMYEWHWEMHPIWWWGWGLGMMAMMLLFWTIVIIGLVIGIRRLLGKEKGEKSDQASRSYVNAMQGGRSTRKSSRPRKRILADEEE